MVTGKTKESIPVSGHYYCQDHPAVESYLEKDSSFPHCQEKDHEAIWRLKDSKNTNDGKAPENKKNTEQDELIPNLFFDIKPKELYKKKGFFAALNHKVDPQVAEYKLEAVIQTEKVISGEEIKELKQKYADKLDILKNELGHLRLLIDEKKDIKQEFVDSLKDMKDAYNQLKSDICNDYKMLGAEINTLGNTQEDLISKRIEKFKTEISNIIAIYDNIEDGQGKKFRNELEIKKITDKDKQFYYDYRDKMESSFNDVEAKIKILERDGLNTVISRFLILIGWTAAFASSWFFGMWYTKYTGTATTNNSSLITYILDNLRYFILQFGWGVTVPVFLAYLSIIMIISRYCHKWSVKHKFLHTKTDDDDIEFSTEKENLLQAQFKAKNWFELWLKITPLLATVLLMITILAIGSKFTPGGTDASYQQLSDALSLQAIGFLLPVAFTCIFFLYITRVIESRGLRKLRRIDPTSAPDASFSWEIPLLAVMFLAFIGLLIASQFKTFQKDLIGPWGFFLGCICTGFSLGYGYRFISLQDAFSTLIWRIQSVNRYIDKTFYPHEISFLKDGHIINRMTKLYHTLLSLVESRNLVAIRLLNPDYKTDTNENPINGDEMSTEDAEEDHESVTDEDNGTEKNTIHHFLQGVVRKVNTILKKLLREKDQTIKTLKAQIRKLQEDNLNVNVLTYFPEVATRINDLKKVIDEKKSELEKIKNELDGYYTNKNTYAIIEKDLTELYDRKQQLGETIAILQLRFIKEQKRIDTEFSHKKIYIEEGYHLGLWYNNNK